MPNVSPLPPVPKAFVSLLEITLQKLVGMNLLQKEFSGVAVFNKIRVKFSNCSKKVCCFLFVCEILNNLFLPTFQTPSHLQNGDSNNTAKASNTNNTAKASNNNSTTKTADIINNNSNAAANAKKSSPPLSRTTVTDNSPQPGPSGKQRKEKENR